MRAGKIRETDKVAVITELRQIYKLTALLQLAEMPRSTYYYYVKQSKKADKYETIKEKITTIYHENQGRYGYRRITLFWFVKIRTALLKRIQLNGRVSY